MPSNRAVRRSSWPSNEPIPGPVARKMPLLESGRRSSSCSSRARKPPPGRRGAGREFRVSSFEFRVPGACPKGAAASDRCAPTGDRSRQPDLTRRRQVRHAAKRFFVAGGFASFFAPLRGTNPPCIRLPASVRSDTALAIRTTRLRPSPFAPRTSALSLRRSARSAGAREDGMPLRISEPERVRRPAPGPEDGRTGLAREGGNRVRTISATRARNPAPGTRN